MATIEKEELQSWAKKLYAGIVKVRTAAMKDDRATAGYWNGGDDFGSSSGMRDAEEWVNGQITAYIVKKTESLLS